MKITKMLVTMPHLGAMILSIKQIFWKLSFCMRLSVNKISDLDVRYAKRFGFSRAVPRKPTPAPHIVAVRNLPNSPPAVYNIAFSRF